MKIKKLNYWSFEIDLEDGRHIYLKDSWLKSYRESKVRLVLSRVFLQIGCISIFCGMMLVVGLIGRSELLSELGEVDDWNCFTYLVYSVGYFLLMISGCLVSLKAEEDEKKYIKTLRALFKQRKL